MPSDYASQRIGIRATFPESWCARGLDANTVVLLPADVHSEDPRDAPAAVAITRARLTSGSDYLAAVRELMRRRIGHGEFEFATVTAFGKTGVETDWTDGIASFMSRFFAHGDSFVEVSYSVAPQRTRRRLEELYQLVDVEWLDEG